MSDRCMESGNLHQFARAWIERREIVDPAPFYLSRFSDGSRQQATMGL